MRKLILTFIAQVLILTNCGPAWDVKKETYEETAPSINQSEEELDQGLKIIIFDVGEGDSTLVVAPGGDAALIDTGPPGVISSIIYPYLSNNKEILLKYLFISHSDSDHAGGLGEIDLKPEQIELGQKFSLGDGVEIEVIAKDCRFIVNLEVPCDPSDDNAHSTALLIRYALFKYLTAGDLPGGGGNPPYETMDLETTLSQMAGNIDVLHTNHHGSNTSTNQNLLKAAKPEVAIISVGNNNDYWHPHPSVIERLINSGIAIYQTERGWLKDEFLDYVHIAGGNITIESDGGSYFLNTPTYGRERYSPSESRP